MRHTGLLRSVAITAPVLLVALSATAQAATRAPGAHSARAALTAAQARALSRNVTDKVIIVFRNQVAGLPDTPGNAARRSSAVHSVQGQVRSSLTATHARNVKSFSLVNAISATVSPGEAKLLAANSAVREVITDRPIPLAASPITKAIRKAA